jgi:hypothetical protein
MRVTDVLQAGLVGVAAIGDARRNDLGIHGAREKQELLKLVAGDIAEDPAIALAGEEPVRPLVVADGMGAQAHRVDDLADGALRDEVAGFHRGTHFEMFGIEHAIDAAGFLLDALDFFQLGEGRHARFVGQDILAVLHCSNGNRGTIGRNGGRRDDRDGLVFQNFPGVSNALGFWKLLGKGGGQIVFHGVEGDELGAGALEAVHLPIDVAVVDADGGKFQVGHRV